MEKRVFLNISFPRQYHTVNVDEKLGKWKKDAHQYTKYTQRLINLNSVT